MVRDWRRVGEALLPHFLRQSRTGLTRGAPVLPAMVRNPPIDGPYVGERPRPIVFVEDHLREEAERFLQEKADRHVYLVAEHGQWYDHPVDLWVSRQVGFMKDGYSELEAFRKTEEIFAQEEDTERAMDAMQQRQAMEIGVPATNVLEAMHKRTEDSMDSVRARTQAVNEERKAKLKANLLQLKEHKELWEAHLAEQAAAEAAGSDVEESGSEEASASEQEEGEEEEGKDGEEKANAEEEDEEEARPLRPYQPLLLWQFKLLNMSHGLLMEVLTENPELIEYVSEDVWAEQPGSRRDHRQEAAMYNPRSAEPWKGGVQPARFMSDNMMEPPEPLPEESINEARELHNQAREWRHKLNLARETILVLVQRFLFGNDEELRVQPTCFRRDNFDYESDDSDEDPEQAVVNLSAVRFPPGLFAMGPNGGSAPPEAMVLEEMESKQLMERLSAEKEVPLSARMGRQERNTSDSWMGDSNEPSRMGRTWAEYGTAKAEESDSEMIVPGAFESNCLAVAEEVRGHDRAYLSELSDDEGEVGFAYPKVMPMSAWKRQRTTLFDVSDEGWERILNYAVAKGILSEDELDQFEKPDDPIRSAMVFYLLQAMDSYVADKAMFSAWRRGAHKLDKADVKRFMRAVGTEASLSESEIEQESEDEVEALLNEEEEEEEQKDQDGPVIHSEIDSLESWLKWHEAQSNMMEERSAMEWQVMEKRRAMMEKRMPAWEKQLEDMILAPPDEVEMDDIFKFLKSRESDVTSDLGIGQEDLASLSHSEAVDRSLADLDDVIDV